jgi:hypothetical protein
MAAPRGYNEKAKQTQQQCISQSNSHFESFLLDAGF